MHRLRQFHLLFQQALLVLLESRLPRTLSVVLTGAALSVAGVLIQALVRNRFVGPDTSGTAEGAALGLFPGLAAEFVQRRVFRVSPGIAADQVQRQHRDVELVPIGVFERHRASKAKR